MTKGTQSGFDSEPLNGVTVSGNQPSSTKSHSNATTTMPETKPHHPRSTIKPPPPSTTLSLIEKTLHITPLPEISPNIFTNTYPLWHPPGARGVYGGAVIAQSLIAATRTVDPALWAHSIHCYFVLAGNASRPITYHVEEIRSGRSFTTREVKAKQGGQTICMLIASFQRPVPREKKERGHGEGEGGVAEHQLPMPKDVPPPDSIPSDLDKAAKVEKDLAALETLIRQKGETNPSDPSIMDGEALLAEGKQFLTRLRNRIERDPFEWRKVTPSFRAQPADFPIPSRKIRYWVRARQPLLSPDAASNQLHLAALAYFSDGSFLATVTRVNPESSTKNLGMMVSLDHSVYFHAGADTKVDGDEWLLVERDSPWMGEERGFVTQRVWRASDGKLVAECTQEGLVRLRDGRVAVDPNGGERSVKAESKL
ncbi:thioesterase-like superfamily-domain-containing protein [Kalaharituber pfeilii]|nr:thioesterase-like superfamily-domain-containing protein [Kalaharituber pfeilii]